MQARGLDRVYCQCLRRSGHTSLHQSQPRRQDLPTKHLQKLAQRQQDCRRLTQHYQTPCLSGCANPPFTVVGSGLAIGSGLPLGSGHLARWCRWCYQWLDDVNSCQQCQEQQPASWLATGSEFPKRKFWWFDSCISGLSRCRKIMWPSTINSEKNPKYIFGAGSQLP